jgi:hypothetical protein
VRIHGEVDPKQKLKRLALPSQSGDDAPGTAVPISDQEFLDRGWSAGALGCSVKIFSIL